MAINGRFPLTMPEPDEQEYAFVVRGRIIASGVDAVKRQGRSIGERVRQVSVRSHELIEDARSGGV